MDPLADLHWDLTPYNYVMNNPLNYVDPFGMDTIRVNNMNSENWKTFNTESDVVELNEVTITPDNQAEESEQSQQSNNSNDWIMGSNSTGGENNQQWPTINRGEIKPYQPNTFGKLKNKIAKLPIGIRQLAEMSYQTADDVYVTFQLGKNRMHLDRSGTTPNEITDAGVSTLVSVLPVSELSGVKSLNAAQFSKLFKGTLILKAPPKLRGYINRGLNKYVIQDWFGLSTGIIQSASEISNDD